MISFGDRFYQKFLQLYIPGSSESIKWSYRGLFFLWPSYNGSDQILDISQVWPVFSQTYIWDSQCVRQHRRQIFQNRSTFWYSPSTQPRHFDIFPIEYVSSAHNSLFSKFSNSSALNVVFQVRSGSITFTQIIGHIFSYSSIELIINLYYGFQ